MHFVKWQVITFLPEKTLLDISGFFRTLIKITVNKTILL